MTPKTAPNRRPSVPSGVPKDPIANGALSSARQEITRADAAAHRAMHCVSKVERQRALNAAKDHTQRALKLMREVNI